jgi:hypothetical protein
MIHFILKSNRCLCAFFFVATILSNVQGQVCTTTNTDNNPGVPGYGTCGNDAWQNGSVKLNVWVAGNGIAWDYLDTAPSPDIIGADRNDFALKPVLCMDVAIVVNSNSEIWALAVYWDYNTSKFYLNSFQGIISTGSFSFSDDGAIEITDVITGFGEYLDPVVRIDANRSGDFVIVLNNPDYSVLQTITGYTNNTGPHLDANGYAIDLDNTYEALEGDVAITESDYHGEAKCFYTYPNSGGSYVKVSVDDYADIAGNHSGNTVTATRTPLTDYVFKTPRISCPSESQYYVGADWSIVWESMNTSTDYSYMKGLTKYSSTVYPGSGSTSYYNYSDASLSPMTDEAKIYQS